MGAVGRRKGEKMAGNRGGRVSARQGKWGAAAAHEAAAAAPLASRNPESDGGEGGDEPMVAGS